MTVAPLTQPDLPIGRGLPPLKAQQFSGHCLTSKVNLCSLGNYSLVLQTSQCIFVSVGSESRSRVIYSDKVSRIAARSGHYRRGLISDKTAKCASRTAATSNSSFSFHPVLNLDDRIQLPGFQSIHDIHGLLAVAARLVQKL
jgi:hypothetical protein